MSVISKSAVLSLMLMAPLAFAQTAAEQVQAAEAAYQQVAQETGYQWLTTTRALKAAKKALEAGQDDEAVKQAKFARDLVEATKLQAQIESTAWQARVPK